MQKTGSIRPKWRKLSLKIVVTGSISFSHLLRYSDPADRLFLIRTISVIFVLRDTTFTISDSTGGPLSLEYEIVRVASLSTTEISEITRLRIQFSWSEHLKGFPQGR